MYSPSIMKTIAGVFIIRATANLVQAHEAVQTSQLNSSVSTSQNWCGAQVMANDNESFTSVSSTIVVPTVTGPTQSEYSSYAWIGIDGWGDYNNLFQAGLDIRAISSKDGGYSPQFRRYYEWYPDEANFVSTEDLPLKGGDTLYISLTVTSTTSGTVYLENQNTGKSFTYRFNEPNYPLTGKYAEWIVEQFPRNPVPEFGSIRFTNTSARTNNGDSYDASAASLIQITTNDMSAELDGSVPIISNTD